MGKAVQQLDLSNDGLDLDQVVSWGAEIDIRIEVFVHFHGSQVKLPLFGIRLGLGQAPRLPNQLF